MLHFEMLGMTLSRLRMRPSLTAFYLVAAISGGAAAPAASDEVRVIAAGGFHSSIDRLAPPFEASTGHKLVLTFGTPAKTRELMLTGTEFDAAIVTAASLDGDAALQLAPGTMFHVATSPVGFGVRADIDAAPFASLAEFKALISRVGTVGLSDPRAGTNLAADILNAATPLGFADELRARARYIVGPGSAVSAEVGRGSLDSVMTLASEIIGVPGVRYLGPAPSELGLGTPFRAGQAVNAATNKGARDLLAYLKGDEAKAAMRAAGLITPE